MYIAQGHAVESVINSEINARYEVNDNIDLAPQPSADTTSLILTPSTSLAFREANWNTSLNARYSDRTSSNSSKDRDDIVLESSGSYQSERNVYAADISYIQNSSLSFESGDFGSTGSEVVERTTIDFSPTYQRQITERTNLLLGYGYTDVSSDREDLGFASYKMDTATVSVSYALSERSQVSGTAILTDYENDDKTNEFRSIATSVGLRHNFSPSLMGNFSFGTSRRDSTRRQFIFGIPLPPNNFSTDGRIYNASITYSHEAGNALFGISRDDQVDSFGSVSVHDSANIRYKNKLTEVISLDVRVNYDKTVAVASAPTSSDKEVWIFEPNISYVLDNHWNLSVSYAYVKRRFLTTSQDTAESNRISLGLEYKFPTISTF